MIDPRQPFVLLDDASGGDAGGARLYTDPVEIVATADPDALPACLARLRSALAEGLHVAGHLAYEAGHLLEPKLRGLRHPQADYLWFGLFRDFTTIAPGELAALLPDPRGAWAGAPQPLISRADYDVAFDRVTAWIAAGDIYQANLTFPCQLPFEGHPLALYARLRSAGGARWGGIVHTGDRWLLSFSPELFFTLEGGRLTTRPMKGTATRCLDRARDTAAAASLAEDPKQRAENLMIVDLLRNDLARVAAPGSVETPRLFTIETYPTVHQMTSTVIADLAPALDAIDVIATIFPCGSVTGAPKIRAMEIIDAIEPHPRGAYTGSIGRIDPGGDAAFNVAIRTLAMKAGERHALIGLGSGIVADSKKGEEWRECLAKGAFVNFGARPFDLIETMRFEDHDGVIDLERHLARMKASADALEFRFDRHEVRNELQAATFRLRDDRKIRLMLSRSGSVSIEVRPMPAPVALAEVRLADLPVDAHDFRLAHKTSDRGFYDSARAAAGSFEVVFSDAHGFLTEGSFTNIFVERDGRLITPPLTRGLLPGILRARLIDEGRAIEGDLRAEDLEAGFFIGNAVRGLIPALLVAGSAGPSL
jgi:para-aminobenzoate synthetase/4-amino-4-deoxychorismate lyase